MIRQFNLFLSALLITVSCFANFSDLFEVDQHIVLNRYQSVSPKFLCHDNVYIYFKNQQTCELAGYSPLLCESNLILTPIRELEKIELNRKDEKTLVRSFKVNLNYETWTYLNEGEGQYVLQPNPAQKQLSLCENRENKKSKVVHSFREAYMESEDKFLNQLVESGFFWIVTGPGAIVSIRQLDLQALELNLQKIDSKIINQNIKSPQCSDKMPDDLIWQMGGELSGNGITSKAFDKIDYNSSQLTWNTLYHQQKVGCKNQGVEI